MKSYIQLTFLILNRFQFAFDSIHEFTNIIIPKVNLAYIYIYIYNDKR